MNLAAPPRNPTISIVGGVKTIRVDGQTYGIEKLIYEMMKSLKKEENLGIEACGTLNITFTREPEKLTVNGTVKKEEKA